MAENKTPALDSIERSSVNKLNDPVINLLLINGWRRNELVQVLLKYKDGDNYAYFVPKKQIKEKRHKLTQREKSLLEVVKIEIMGGIKPNKGSYNKKINRHFQILSKKLGFHIWPHRLRTTFATGLDRMGVTTPVISAAMNHSNISSTHGYIRPGEEDIYEAKELADEMKTLDGLTIHEWRKKHTDNLKIIRRLELQIQKLKEQSNEL